jgi:hypothetical protein
VTGWNKAHPPFSPGLSTAERAVFTGALWRAERRIGQISGAKPFVRALLPLEVTHPLTSLVMVNRRSVRRRHRRAAPRAEGE